MAERTSDRDAKRFDPRFSPEFQPGFDARVHRQQPPAMNRETAARGTAPSLITRTSRPASTVDTDAAASAPYSDAAAQQTVTDAASPVDAANDDLHDVPTQWWRRLNPYLVALGVIGVVIMVAAAAGVQYVYDAATNSYTNQFDYIFVQLAVYGAPVVFSVGLATLVSIVVILAARWRR